MGTQTQAVSEVDIGQTAPKLFTRLSCLDAVRGFGALWVLSFHVTHSQPGPIGLRYFITLPIDYAHLAFIYFVVISGFCIHLNAARSILLTGAPRQKWSDFWKRRIHRLYPPYLVAIAIALILRELVKSKSLFPHASPLIPDLAAHMIMIHNLIPQFINGVGNPPMWSLALEEQLYALYSPLMMLRKRFSIEKISVITFLIGLVWVTVLSPLSGTTVRAERWWYFWPFTYWFAWTLGAFAVEIYVGTAKDKPIYHSFPLALGLLAVGFMTSNPILGMFTKTNLFVSHFGTGLLPLICRLLVNTSNFIFVGAIFILTNKLVYAEKRGTPYRFPRIIFWLGTFSYSFYLIHEPVVRLIESYVGHGTSPVEIMFRYILIVPVCFALSWIFFQLVEKRFLNKRQIAVPQQNSAIGISSEKA